MYATGNKKNLNMLILGILKEYSDEEHKLTQQEIIRLLKSIHGIECDRRSVKNNILYLIDADYDISIEDGYYLRTRDFQDAELRMLIDSVFFSRNLTQSQANSLIERLKKLGNRYFSAKVGYICNLPDLYHADNKQLWYTLDAINDAIAEKRKISFIYNSYGLDFKLHSKREEPYIVSPYQIVANNGRYYLIGNYDKYDNISHYRIDRMTEVKILDERVKEKDKIIEFAHGYNLPKHMAEHIYMFSGPSVRVKLLVSQSIMDQMVDWFGKDFRIRKTDVDGMMEVSVNCNERAMFYWALQYGEHVEVLKPDALREKLKETVEGMCRKYKEH